MVYLFDSNTIIDYLSLSMRRSSLDRISQIADNRLLVSVITKIEVLGFVSRNQELNRRTEGIMDTATVLNLTSGIVNKTIEIRKSKAVKLPDAIIAATCLAYDLTLLTRNVNDFKKIPGLNVIDPHLL